MLQRISEDSLIVSLGGELGYTPSSGHKLSGKFDFGYDLSADQSSVRSASGGGPSFVTRGSEPDALVIRCGWGYEFVNSYGLEIAARYDVEAREDFTNQTAAIHFRLPF